MIRKTGEPLTKIRKLVCGQMVRRLTLNTEVTVQLYGHVLWGMQSGRLELEPGQCQGGSWEAYPWMSSLDPREAV